jgi:hypothetical protein
MSGLFPQRREAPMTLRSAGFVIALLAAFIVVVSMA